MKRNDWEGPPNVLTEMGTYEDLRQLREIGGFTPVSPAFLSFSQNILERLLRRDLHGWRKFTLQFLEEDALAPAAPPVYMNALSLRLFLQLVHNAAGSHLVRLGDMRVSQKYGIDYAADALPPKHRLPTGVQDDTVSAPKEDMRLLAQIQKYYAVAKEGAVFEMAYSHAHIQPLTLLERQVQEMQSVEKTETGFQTKKEIRTHALETAGETNTLPLQASMLGVEREGEQSEIVREKALWQTQNAHGDREAYFFQMLQGAQDIEQLRTIVQELYAKQAQNSVTAPKNMGILAQIALRLQKQKEGDSPLLPGQSIYLAQENARWMGDRAYFADETLVFFEENEVSGPALAGSEKEKQDSQALLHAAQSQRALADQTKMQTQRLAQAYYLLRQGNNAYHISPHIQAEAGRLTRIAQHYAVDHRTYAQTILPQPAQAEAALQQRETLPSRPAMLTQNAYYRLFADALLSKAKTPRKWEGGASQGSHLSVMEWARMQHIAGAPLTHRVELSAGESGGIEVFAQPHPPIGRSKEEAAAWGQAPRQQKNVFSRVIERVFKDFADVAETQSERPSKSQASLYYEMLRKDADQILGTAFTKRHTARYFEKILQTVTSGAPQGVQPALLYMESAHDAAEGRRSGQRSETIRTETSRENEKLYTQDRFFTSGNEAVSAVYYPMMERLWTQRTQTKLYGSSEGVQAHRRKGHTFFSLVYGADGRANAAQQPMEVPRVENASATGQSAHKDITAPSRLSMPGMLAERALQIVVQMAYRRGAPAVDYAATYGQAAQAGASTGLMHLEESFGADIFAHTVHEVAEQFLHKSNQSTKHEIDTLLRARRVQRAIHSHRRQDLIGRDTLLRVKKGIQKQISDPARVIHFVPPAYQGQFGRDMPIGRMDWQQFGYDRHGKPPTRDTLVEPKTAPEQVVAAQLNPQEAEARAFFEDYARLFQGVQANVQAQNVQTSSGQVTLSHAPPVSGHMQTQPQAHITPFSPSAAQAAPITYRQSDGQHAQPQSNAPAMRSLNVALEKKKDVYGLEEFPFTKSQIDRLTDRIFDQIERKIISERRRFGL